MPKLQLTRFREVRLSILRGEFRELLPFLGTTNLYASFKLAQNNVPMLLVGYWLSPVEAGYFQLARKISNLMTLPVGPLTVSSYPEFARLWHSGKTGAFKHLAGRLTILLSVLAVIMLSAIFAVAGRAVGWAFGAEYLPAVPVIYWMSAAMAIAVAANTAGPLLVASGRAGSNLAAMSIATVVQLGALAVLLPRAGVVGAGVSYVLFHIVWVIIIGVSVRSLFRAQLAHELDLVYR
jgi:O-antigen/teichoic acid export membrane protein